MDTSNCSQWLNAHTANFNNAAELAKDLASLEADLQQKDGAAKDEQSIAELHEKVESVLDDLRALTNTGGFKGLEVDDRRNGEELILNAVKRLKSLDQRLPPTAGRVSSVASKALGRPVTRDGIGAPSKPGGPGGPGRAGGTPGVTMAAGKYQPKTRPADPTPAPASDDSGRGEPLHPGGVRPNPETSDLSTSSSDDSTPEGSSSKPGGDGTKVDPLYEEGAQSYWEVARPDAGDEAGSEAVEGGTEAPTPAGAQPGGRALPGGAPLPGGAKPTALPGGAPLPGGAKPTALPGGAPLPGGAKPTALPGGAPLPDSNRGESGTGDGDDLDSVD